MKATKIFAGLAGLAIPAAAALAIQAPAAHAYPGYYTVAEDNAYVSALTAVGISNAFGPAGLIIAGHKIANDLAAGVSVSTEDEVVYEETSASVSHADANNMVGYADLIYLHQSPNS
jgi:hypothetical protein